MQGFRVIISSMKRQGCTARKTPHLYLNLDNFHKSVITNWDIVIIFCLLSKSLEVYTAVLKRIKNYMVLLSESLHNNYP